LPDLELYTSHTNRKYGATALAENGASITAIKTAGGWQSNPVCETYIADCRLNAKKKIANKLSLFKSDSSSPQQQNDFILKSAEQKILIMHLRIILYLLSL
jgi:hypothetical protein